MSESSKDKIRCARDRQIITDVHKLHISEGLKKAYRDGRRISTGGVWTEERRRLARLSGMMQKQKGLWTDERRMKISVGLKGNTNFKGKCHGEETRKKISDAHKGVKLSDYHRMKLSEAHKGYKIKEETKLKLSIANRGRIYSEEMKLKFSEAQKKRWAERPITEVQRRHYSESHKGLKYSEEYKRQMAIIKAREIVAGVGRRDEFTYGGLKFRSENEIKVAKWLDSAGMKWEYESEYFVLANGRCYVPDFRLEGNDYLEVKNRFNARDFMKLALFAADHKLNVIDASTMKMEVW